MKKLLLFLPLLLLLTFTGSGQAGGLSLQDCYRLANQNYPLVKRYELIQKTADYTIENLHKGYLPQLSANAQATYQSATTEVPLHLPGVSIPVISKDQYKAYAQADQVLYDGGAIATQKELQKNNAVVARQQLAAELYQLKARINQLFFGILLVNEQLKQNNLLAADLQLGLNKVQASVTNGTAFRSSADLIRAEILSIQQQAIELKASRKALTDMLGQFTGQTIPDTAILIRPAPVHLSDHIKRPELAVFEAQQQLLRTQDKLLTVNTLPRLGLFVQGGYGRPALNMLSNKFEGYYLGGLRATWSPSVFYTLKRKRAEIQISHQEIAVQQENFLFNTTLTVKQQNADISKFQQLLTADDEIIRLRSQVKTAALAQLENGVITSNDFLKEVNDEDRARQNKLLHEVQLLIAQYNQQTTTGNQP